MLKTLEEPPEHVKFMLATTEPEKVLPTILSRCQRYDFRNIPTREIAKHLKGICVSEKIEADDEALAPRRQGRGRDRCAMRSSLLDRLLSIGEKHLTVQTIEQLLGLPRSQLVFDLADAIRPGRRRGDADAGRRHAEHGFVAGCDGGGVGGSFAEPAGAADLRPGQRPGGRAGTGAADLQRQAGQFDAATLAQDIAILEELRRSIRQSHTGRALLDATLVRLALARQFSSIAQLLGQVDQGAAGDEAQKKTMSR